jgi:hypothetical protein
MHEQLPVVPVGERGTVSLQDARSRQCRSHARGGYAVGENRLRGRKLGPNAPLEGRDLGRFGDAVGEGGDFEEESHWRIIQDHNIIIAA